MYKYLIALVLILPLNASAALQYCTGEVDQIVTRNSDEGTDVKLLVNGVASNYARIINIVRDAEGNEISHGYTEEQK